MRCTAARVARLYALMLIGWLPASHAQTSERVSEHLSARWSAAGGTASVQVRLGRPAQRDAQDRFPLIAIDTLFYIDNRGLTRLLVNLNGHQFKLATDPEEVRQSANAFLIPEFGDVTFNIAPYLNPDDDDPFDDTCEEGDPSSGNNCIEIVSQGPSGTDAQVVIGDLFVPGQRVAHPVTGLTDLPADFALLLNAPNPFATTTTIPYHIRENRTTGLHISIAIYNVAGRRVRTLVDERRYPGRFEVVWDGTGDDGVPVASGLYLCQMTAESVRETITMVYIR